VDHNDTAVAYYFQGRDKSIDERARIQLLGQLLESPFYFDLRTTHRVGYLVFGSAMNILEVPGLLLSVQSPSHDAPSISGLIEQFLAGFPNQLAALTDAQFLQVRNGLVAQILQRDNKLSTRTNRYWNEIDLRQLEFDSRQQLAGAIGALSKQDILDYMQTLFIDEQRALIIQSPGRRADAAEKLIDQAGYVKTGTPKTFRSGATQFFPGL
jgi:secreted Zn-dependent insulinase-like peptidase